MGKGVECMVVAHVLGVVEVRDWRGSAARVMVGSISESGGEGARPWRRLGLLVHLP